MLKLDGGQGHADLSLGVGWNPQRLRVAVLITGVDPIILAAKTSAWPH